jgi:molecular chaperone DnaJ
LEEAAFGCEKEIERDYRALCGSCNGTGADQSKGYSVCGTCGGAGEVIAHKGFITVKQTCPACGGSGRVGHPCETCHGEGKVSRKETLNVKFPKGIATGHRIKLDGKGDEFLPGRFGDLYLDIHVLESDNFERRGNSIHTKIHVDYATLVLGGSAEVLSLRGVKKIKVPRMLKPGSKIRIKGGGIADVRTGDVGDHYVEVLLKLPDSLSPELTTLLEKMREIS